MRVGLCTLACPAFALASPATADTSEFLTKALGGDNSEMKLGALAAKQDRSAQVRKFGAMLERDHRAAKVQAGSLAARHQVAIPAAMAEEAQAEYAKLEPIHGPAFDQEFARHMADDHKKDIADFESKAASKDPLDVRARAQDIADLAQAFDHRPVDPLASLHGAAE